MIRNHLKKKISISISLGIILFICAAPLKGQRQIDLTVDTILTPDTVFEKVQPIVTYVIRNLGPDSIYISDTLLYAFGFSPPWGASNDFPNRIRDAMDYYKMPFTKNLGAGDTVIMMWLCPSTFKLPYTMIGELGIGCHFISGRNNKLEEDLNQRNNGATRYDIVYFFPISGIHSIASNKTSPYPNPIEADGLLHIDNSDGSILNISIYDAIGRRKIYCNTTIDGHITIDTNALGMPPGVYFMSIDDGDKTKTIRIIK